MNGFELVTSTGLGLPVGSPSIPVFHPQYGLLGKSVPGVGFVPDPSRKRSVAAIMRDQSRLAIQTFRALEDSCSALGSGLHRLLAENPHLAPIALNVISTFDGIINARTGGNYWDWWDGMTTSQTPIAGAWYNLTSRIAQTARASLTYGTYVNAGNNGAIMNAATTGAIPIPYAGSNSRYLTAFAGQVTAINGFSALMLVDILWAGGPITYGSGASVAATSTSPTLTRYTGSSAAYSGNMLMCDVGTLLGGTPGSISFNYTAQDNTTTRSTTAFTPTTAAGTANRVLQNGVTIGPAFTPLVSGDTGVSHVNSVTFGAGTSPTGTIYLNIVRPLLVIPTLAANSFVERDITTTMDSLIELVKGTDSQHGCLAVLGLGNGTTAGQLYYSLRTVAG